MAATVTDVQYSQQWPASNLLPVLREATPVQRDAARWPLPRRVELAEPRRLNLALVEGEIQVDNARVPVPSGVGSFITGAALRVLARVYRGFAIYLANGDGLTRVRDDDVVQITSETRVVSRDERPPVIVSRPRYSRD